MRIEKLKEFKEELRKNIFFVKIIKFFIYI